MTATFLLRTRPSGADDLWPQDTRDGQSLLSSDGEIYGDLFVAEGLAEQRSGGDQSYADIARELVLKCVRLYDQADYRPVIGRTYLGPGGAPVRGRASSVRGLCCCVSARRCSNGTRIRNLRRWRDARPRRSCRLISIQSLRLQRAAESRSVATRQRVCPVCLHGPQRRSALDGAARGAASRDQALFTLAADRYRRHIAVA